MRFRLVKKMKTLKLYQKVFKDKARIKSLKLTKKKKKSHPLLIELVYEKGNEIYLLDKELK